MPYYQTSRRGFLKAFGGSLAAGGLVDFLNGCATSPEHEFEDIRLKPGETINAKVDGTNYSITLERVYQSQSNNVYTSNADINVNGRVMTFVDDGTGTVNGLRARLVNGQLEANDPEYVGKDILDVMGIYGAQTPNDTSDDYVNITLAAFSGKIKTPNN